MWVRLLWDAKQGTFSKLHRLPFLQEHTWFLGFQKNCKLSCFLHFHFHRLFLISCSPLKKFYFSLPKRCCSLTAQNVSSSLYKCKPSNSTTCKIPTTTATTHQKQMLPFATSMASQAQNFGHPNKISSQNNLTSEWSVRTSRWEWRSTTTQNREEVEASWAAEEEIEEVTIDLSVASVRREWIGRRVYSIDFFKSFLHPEINPTSGFWLLAIVQIDSKFLASRNQANA